MVVGVVTHHVPLLVLPPDQLRVRPSLIAAYEEGGLRVVRFRASRTLGVLFGSGPSSKVSAMSTLGRSSTIMVR